MSQKEIFLKDYRTPNYWVNNIALDVDINEKTIVTNRTSYTINTEHNENTLVLDGVDIKLLEITVNAESFTNYEVKGHELFLTDLPGEFELVTKVEIDPAKNLTGEGFYQSGDIFCTQCEAQGFRRITYFLDRPDVMASFTTTLRADKTKYPMLLSNGNPVEKGDLDNGRHFVTWEDPFKKPAYLFAMVAGDLGVVTDTFTTKSGRTVALEIYVDKGNEDKTAHAMESLKKSMKWDEDVFGLEYDLDIYMIVAVDSFNMGAMENKGLNIFNSAYVLAKPETASDADFMGIEAVIGHEYFHNWTGNRVTCRDWFQLTLKEGLTVFRDQEFSSDMQSRAVKRIEDVAGLRSHQFSEDAGPMSHPIKPKSFVEINNFYTATIYEKGAEVIRMIHTLLGKDNFRKGMDLYFKRHDGQAATTEDFVAAMTDASGVNLDQFKVWYDQNGTPILNISTEYLAGEQEFKLKIVQDTKLNNNDYDALHIPFHLALYSKDGTAFEIPQDGKYELKEKEVTLSFKNITSKPVVSFNRNFSAPVIVNYEYTLEELATLMAHDTDLFNQYDATQKMSELEINRLKNEYMQGKTPEVSPLYLSAYQKLLEAHQLDSAFRAYALELPYLKDLNEKLEKYDFDALPKAIELLKTTIGTKFEKQLGEIVERYKQGEYKLTTEAVGARELRGYAFDYLFHAHKEKYTKDIYEFYASANNMTDETCGLAILSRKKNEFQTKAMNEFYDKWKHETLVFQKWLSICTRDESLKIEELKRFEALPECDLKVPNIIRSLLRGFLSNQLKFHAEDGSGYRYMADKIIEIDSYNPQIAANVCKQLKFLKKVEGKRYQALKTELERIKSSSNLSSDTLEVVNKNLE